MRKGQKRIRTAILSVLLVLLIGSGAYIVFDNQRFIVVEQEITIERLPQSFDGFRILQISDLHGRYFGEKQADLIRAINSLEYDMIAFTGDMNDSTSLGGEVEDAQAVLDLLDGIANKENVFWVDGNTGPHAIETYSSAKTGEVTKIGAVLREKGCQMLTLPRAITRGEDRIWITPEMSEMTFNASYRSMSGDEWYLGGKDTYDRVQAFYEEAYRAFQEINGNGEVKIMMEHYPQQTNLSAEDRKLKGDLDYDLIIAGHYHGGQIRLPWIGALYIPSPTTGINNSGFFPDQTNVMGLGYYGDVPQYVSAGLGSSGHVRVADFRLFNTPEMNLITLKR